MLAEIDAAIAQLTGSDPLLKRIEDRRKGIAKRTMSVKARKAIAEAQKKRWEAHRAKTAPAPAVGAKPVKRPKRTMSAAGRKRIVDATKKRWAEFRAKKAAEEKGKPKAATAAS